MDHLPPTVTDPELLELLGSVLVNEPTTQSTRALCSRFFQPDFSWQALVNLAIAHDVLPPLVFALTERSLLPPVPSTLKPEARIAHVTSRLAAAYSEHLDRQADLREQLLAVLAALNREDITPLLLKGATHLTMTHPRWHAARGMRDLDILVPASKAERANRALTSRGYRADLDPLPIDRHLPELRLPGRAGTVELHIEALSFAARHALTTAEVWERAELKNFADVTFLVLAPEWHLLHGLLHHQLADHGHARRMLAIKGLWEFFRVGSEVSAEGWCAIIAHARQRECLDVLSSWSIQANRLFGLKAPQELLALEAGRKHADATFRRARAPYRLRQALFVADKLRFAFAPETLGLRYGSGETVGTAALRHLALLWRRRGPMARRWLGR